MAGFLPKTGNHALISANFGAKVGPLRTEPCSLRQAARRKEHGKSEYDKEITALLVIDPYNDFIAEGGKI